MNTDYFPSPLAAKVAARNAANTQAVELAPRLLEVLKPWLGQQVINADGSLKKKLRDALEPFRCNKPLERVWIDSSGYSIRVEISRDGFVRGKNGYDHSYQEKAVVYLADLQHGHTITKFYDFNPADWRTDYKTEQIHSARLNVERIKKELSSAQSALAGFGEYDQ